MWPTYTSWPYKAYTGDYPGTPGSGDQGELQPWSHRTPLLHEQEMQLIYLVHRKKNKNKNTKQANEETKEYLPNERIRQNLRKRTKGNKDRQFIR